MNLMSKLTELMERFRYIDERTTTVLAILGIMVFIGLLNCILGYRLMRFWMMLGGFAIGAIFGYMVVETIGLYGKNYNIFAASGGGILFGILAFFIYKVGIFMIGAGTGIAITMYVIRPTTSATFFACLLVSVMIGVLAVRFSREVIIFTTSILGGALIGLGGARLADLSDLPYGLLIGAVSALVGILVQFAMNKVQEDEVDQTVV